MKVLDKQSVSIYKELIKGFSKKLLLWGREFENRPSSRQEFFRKQSRSKAKKARVPNIHNIYMLWLLGTFFYGLNRQGQTGRVAETLKQCHSKRSRIYGMINQIVRAIFAHFKFIFTNLIGWENLNRIMQHQTDSALVLYPKLFVTKINIILRTNIISTETGMEYAGIQSLYLS